jgi:hypothetical protein
MEAIANAFLNSAKSYLNRLQYLGDVDDKTLNDLSFYLVLNDLLNKADWFELHEINKLKIMNKIEQIVRSNPKLERIVYDFRNMPVNVNNPQSIYT